MWPFKKKAPIDLDALYAKAMAQQVLEDRLFDEWRDGPGTNWPTSIVMMREIEGAPLKPMVQWKDGWVEAFYDWAKPRGLNGPA